METSKRSAGGDPQRADPARTLRWRVALPAFAALVVAILASLLFGLTLKEKAATEMQPIQERGTMLQTTQKTTGPAAIPPIDAEAPKKFETATFALG